MGEDQGGGGLFPSLIPSRKGTGLERHLQFMRRETAVRVTGSTPARRIGMGRTLPALRAKSVNSQSGSDAAHSHSLSHPSRKGTGLERHLQFMRREGGGQGGRLYSGTAAGDGSDLTGVTGEIGKFAPPQ